MPTQRQHDRYIMEIAIQSALFTTSDLEKINHVWIYLQVLTVADIINAAGTHLQLHGLYKSTRIKKETNYIQINQNNPPSSLWNLWYDLITVLSDTDGKLYQSLGNWTVHPKDIRMKWSHFYSSSLDTIIDSNTLTCFLR